MTDTAFQSDAFQNDAFQIAATVSSSGGGSGGTSAANDYPFGLEYWRRPAKRTPRRKAERVPAFSQAEPVPPTIPAPAPPPIDPTMQATLAMVSETQRLAARRRDEEALLLFL